MVVVVAAVVVVAVVMVVGGLSFVLPAVKANGCGDHGMQGGAC